MGERLRPGPVQPDRPQHRRHRHRRQERRDPADPQREDPGPRGGKILPLRRPWAGPPRQRESCEGFLLKDEAKKQVTCPHPARPRRKDRRDAVPDPGDPGRTVPGGVPSCSPAAPTRSASPWRRIGCPLLGDGKYGRGDVQPPLRRDPPGPVLLQARLLLPHGRRAFWSTCGAGTFTVDGGPLPGSSILPGEKSS